MSKINDNMSFQEFIALLCVLTATLFFSTGFFLFVFDLIDFMEIDWVVYVLFMGCPIAFYCIIFALDYLYEKYWS
jgi:hypothetical protein